MLKSLASKDCAEMLMARWVNCEFCSRLTPHEAGEEEESVGWAKAR